MSDESDDRVTLTIPWTDYASTNLNARIEELRRRDQHVAMDPVVEGVQFLRGVGSRAGFMLSAFYTLIGSTTPPKAPREPPWKPTQAAGLEFSALQTVTLICRSIFDDSRKGLTGKRFVAGSSRARLRV
jgi:hypothetical protein